MPFGNAILVAFFFVFYVVGISDTICGHAEHTIYSLADVAHQQQFELALRSNDPEWCREGMQLFAYELAGPKWNKRDITWGIEQYSQTIKTPNLIKVAGVAFAKWSVWTSLNFRGPVEKPDIRIKFVPHLEKKSSLVEYIELRGGNEGMKTLILDAEGARIVISDSTNWNFSQRPHFGNIGFALLHQIGLCLGLGKSKVRDAVMFHFPENLIARYHVQLTKDDIDGIQRLYGPPSLRKPWGGREPQRPVSSSPQLPASSSSQLPASSSSHLPASSSSQSSSSESSSDDSSETEDTDTD